MALRTEREDGWRRRKNESSKETYNTIHSCLMQITLGSTLSTSAPFWKDVGMWKCHMETLVSKHSWLLLLDDPLGFGETMLCSSSVRNNTLPLVLGTYSERRQILMKFPILSLFQMNSSRNEFQLLFGEGFFGDAISSICLALY